MTALDCLVLMCLVDPIESMLDSFFEGNLRYISQKLFGLRNVMITGSTGDFRPECR